MINAFTAIFLPILLGIIVRTGNFIPAGNRPVLQQFTVRIAIPFLIFSSLQSLDTNTASQFLPLSLGLFLFMAMTWSFLLVTILFLQKKIPWIRMHRSELLLMSFTGNIAYVCWKLHELLIGIPGLQRGIFYTSFYWPFLFLFAAFSVLVLGLSKEKELDKKELFYNIAPILLALFTGLSVGLTGVSVPQWILQFTDTFGSMAIPLILFCMGLSLSVRRSIKTAGPLFPFLILRLSVWILATFIMLKLPWFDESSRKVLMINTFAPLGVAPIAVSDMFGMDTEFIANSTIISTLLYLLFIPVMFMVWG